MRHVESGQATDHRSPFARPSAPTDGPILSATVDAPASLAPSVPYLGIDDLVPPASAPPSAVAPLDTRLDRAKLAQRANDLFVAFDGWGTDEAAVSQALSGLSPAEIANLKAQYAGQTGRTLDADLEGELGGDDLASAQAQLAGGASATAASLFDSMRGWGTDEARLMDTLRDVPAEQRGEVEAAYAKLASSSLSDSLRDELSGTEAEAAELQRRGKTDEADAATLAGAVHPLMEWFFGPDTNTVDNVLVRRAATSGAGADNDALRAAYEQRTNADLSKDYRRATDRMLFSANPTADYADALLARDENGASAARIERALQGLGTDEDAIFEELQRDDPERRRGTRAAFNARYGSFDTALAGDLEGNDLERAKQLDKNGKLDRVFAMRYALEGLGTNLDVMNEGLADMSPSEAAQLERDYQAQTGRPLAADMHGDLSGRDEHYQLQKLYGTKDLSLAEQAMNADSDYAFERPYVRPGSLQNGARWLMDSIYEAGPRLDREYAQMNRLYATSGADEAIARNLAQQKLTIDAHHRAQDAAADNVTTVAGTAAGAAATVATFGMGAPAAVALGAGAFATGATGMVAKHAIKGPGYGVGDAGVDAALTAVNTLAAGAGGSETLLGKHLARKFAVTGKVGAMSGLATGLLDENTWTKGNGASRVLQSTVAGGVGALGGGVANEVIPGGEACLVPRGAASGALGSAIQTALSPDPTPQSVLQSAVVGGVGGATANYLEVPKPAPRR